MKWFFDNNLARGLAESIAPVLRIILRRHGDSVVHLRDMFPQDAKDVDWLRNLVPKGEWVIVSGDADIIRVPAERQAWIESGHVAFFLAPGWTQLDPLVQLRKLAELMPTLIEHAERLRGPVGLRVPLRSTKLDRIYP